MRDLPGQPPLRAELRLHRAQRQCFQRADRAQPEQREPPLHLRRHRSSAAGSGARYATVSPGGTQATVPAAARRAAIHAAPRPSATPTAAT